MLWVTASGFIAYLMSYILWENNCILLRFIYGGQSKISASFVDNIIMHPRFLLDTKRLSECLMCKILVSLCLRPLGINFCQSYGNKKYVLFAFCTWYTSFPCAMEIFVLHQSAQVIPSSKICNMCLNDGPS